MVNIQDTHNLLKCAPLIISTSLGMKLISSCTSRHGCRASLRIKFPDPVIEIYEMYKAEVDEIFTPLQDFWLHIRFRCIDCNVCKATDDADEPRVEYISLENARYDDV